jgi:hypothetical protein
MAVPDGTTQEQDTGEEIPGQQNLTLPYSTQVAVPMVGQRTPYLGTNIAPYAGTINASLSGTWPMPTATVIPGPPHLPPTGVSLHSGTYDFISADADDQAAVLVMLDTLLNTTYGPMPSPQQVKLLETMLRATPEQLRISGNQAVLDNLEAAGYFSSVERDRALAEGVVESYQTTWTQDQKDMWDRLGRRQAGAVYGGAGGLSWLTTDPSRVAGDEAPFSQAETENRLRQMQAIYGDTLRMAGDAGTVAVDPEAPLASLLNEQFWQDQPELADLGQQVIRSRGVILSYNEFVAAHNLDPTLRQTKIQYQDLLLRETYNANATTTDPAEFIYYDWNPSNPDARVTVKRGDEIDGEIYASLAANADAVMQLSEMSDIERAEAARQAALAPQTAEPGEAPPTVMTASQFAKANYGATAYGKAEAQRIVDTLATYNIDVPVDSIAWVGSGGYNLYPTVAGAQVPGLSLVGYDPNALPPDTLTEIANVLQMNLPADTELGGSFSKLVEDAKEDPELLDTLSFAMQTIGNTNPMAQTLMSQQLSTTRWQTTSGSTRAGTRHPSPTSGRCPSSASTRHPGSTSNSPPSGWARWPPPWAVSKGGAPPTPSRT